MWSLKQSAGMAAWNNIQNKVKLIIVGSISYCQGNCILLYVVILKAARCLLKSCIVSSL